MRWFSWALLLLGILCLAQQPRAQYQSFPPGVFTGRAALDAASGGGGGCAQATAYLARVSYGTTDSTNYTNLICGLVTDSVWSSIDALYIFAAPDSTSALFNLVSTSFSITSHGTVTFTANTGEAGDGSTGYFDTGFNPNSAGGNYALNSAHVSFCSNGTLTSGGIVHGASHTGNNSIVDTLGNSNSATWVINDLTGATAGVGTQLAGFYVGSRTGSAAGEIYKNGSANTAYSATSIAVPDHNMFWFNRSNASGSPTGAYSSQQLSMGSFGAGLNSTQVSNFQTRINTFMTAYSLSSC